MNFTHMEGGGGGVKNLESTIRASSNETVKRFSGKVALNAQMGNKRNAGGPLKISWTPGDINILHVASDVYIYFYTRIYIYFFFVSQVIRTLAGLRRFPAILSNFFTRIIFRLILVKNRRSCLMTFDCWQSLGKWTEEKTRSGIGRRS